MATTATKSALSNVDIIRRFVYQNQPVSLEEIAAELKSQMTSLKTDEQAEKNAQIVLDKNSYFRRTDDGKWEVEVSQMPEYKALPEVLAEAHQVLYERDVRSKVAQKLGWKVASVVLDMFRAEGVKRFGASRWGLDHWVLGNDHAADVLKANPNGLSDKDLLKQVAERFKLDPAAVVFNFTGDKRFVPERKQWLLREHAENKKAREPKAAAAKRKEVTVDEQLEAGFLQAQTTRSDEESGDGERLIKSRLRKATLKQAQEIIETREDLQPARQQDFAARLSQQLSAAGMDEYDVTSFQRVESAPKERGLNTKEREEINQFVSQLLEQETVGMGVSLQAIANAPLSARKMQDVLRLKYAAYARDRVVLPTEYYALLVELLKPTITKPTLHPSCMEGMLSIELFTYLYDRLEDAAWALTDDGGNLEIVQRDGQRYRLTADDPQLIEQARDKFIVNQVDLVNHYLNNRYTGIEADKVLARAARVTTRLSGFENAYIVSRDYLTELPEVFGYQHDEENLIPDVFDVVLGNYTFTQDANLSANYLDTSLKVLAPGGRLGVFVLAELLTLLKEHGLLGDFLRGMGVTHFIRLPQIERHNVVLLVIEALHGEVRSEKPITVAELEDPRGASALAAALRGDEDATEGLYSTIEAHALGTLIG